jgi:5-methylcytosine-specific restriction endonuclease McrA
MAGRPDLATYEHRKQAKQILAQSTICILCGHPGSDAIDHVIPVDKGGDPVALDNKAPIHGVTGCPICARKCNSEKGNKLLTQVKRLKTSRDWYAGP